MNRLALQARIYVAGHRGLVGASIVRALRRQGYTNLLVRTHAELDLTRQDEVERFFKVERPEVVFLAAAKVGGILANTTYPAEFIRDNLLIQTNVIEATRRVGVERLLFLGSSSVYPRLCPQPIREEYLLTGPIEPTNRPYAIAKIAGIELCWSCNRQYGTQFLAAMPSNLYGPDDHFDLNNAHVLPALLRKTAEAKLAGSEELIVWGSGMPRRELMYADDLADACVFLMSLDDDRFRLLIRDEAAPVINVGTGEDVTIRELAEIVSRVLGFDGRLVFDSSKPDGTSRKLLDVTPLHDLGWRHTTGLEQGIRLTWEAVRSRLAPML